MRNNWLSYSPHIHSKEKVNDIYLLFILALMPTMVDAVIKYGTSAFLMCLLSIIGAVACSVVSSLIKYKRVSYFDLSPVFVGLLLALTTPAGAPVWMPMVGAILATIFVKEFFGGVGKNLVSEAAAGRVVLALMFGVTYLKFIDPIYGDASNSIIAQIISGDKYYLDYEDLLFYGTASGIGESSIIWLLAGGIMLCASKVIDYKIPLSYLLTTFILSLIFWGYSGAVALVLGGGCLLVGFFVITDYSSSPNTSIFRVLYGVIIGLLTVLIWKYGNSLSGAYFAAIIGGLGYGSLKWLAPRILKRQEA